MTNEHNRDSLASGFEPGELANGKARIGVPQDYQAEEAARQKFKEHLRNAGLADSDDANLDAIISAKMEGVAAANKSQDGGDIEMEEGDSTAQA